jgi:hypothetical protein
MQDSNPQKRRRIDDGPEHYIGPGQVVTTESDVLRCGPLVSFIWIAHASPAAGLYRVHPGAQWARDVLPPGRAGFLCEWHGGADQ